MEFRFMNASPFWGEWFVQVGSILLMLFSTVLLGILFYRRYLGIGAGKAFLLVLLVVVLSAIYAPWGPLHRGAPFAQPWQFRLPREFFALLPAWLFRFALFFFTIPFCAKLYLKWVHDHQMTPAERSTGMEGVRAWLGSGNLIVALIISALASVNGFSFLSVLLLTLLALLAYPLLGTILRDLPSTIASSEPPRDDLSAEREKVLKLLEEGKITADEASELLNALGQTVRPREMGSVPVTPSRRAVFLGVALLIAGFLLPWASFSSAQFFGGPMNVAVREQTLAHSHTTFWLSGGAIPHGLGWLVLLLGVTAAAIPSLTRHWDRQTQRNWVLATLGIGALVLFILVVQIDGEIGVGLLLAIAGYALEFFGTIRDYGAAARAA